MSIEPMDPDAPPPSRPMPVLVRSVGILNIVFGGLALLGYALLALIVVGFPIADRALEDFGRAQAEEAMAERQAQLDALAEEAEAAESDEERARLEADRALLELEEPGQIPMFGFGIGLFSDARVQAASWLRIGLMVPLFGALIASGVGLARGRRWGRSVAIATSALIIVATVVADLATIGVARIMAEGWTGDMRQMIEADDVERSEEYEALIDRYEREMVRPFVISSVVTDALGLIYPLAVIIVLGRPRRRPDDDAPPEPTARIERHELKYVRPRPGTAKALGGLSIALGTLTLTMAYAALNQALFGTLSVRPSETLSEAIEAHAEAEHRADLGRLRALEAGAGSEAALEVYRQERARLEGRGPVTPPLEMMTLNAQLTEMTAWTWADSTTSIVLNVLLIVSGAGLVQLAEWGRRLGLWVGGIKLVRLAVLQLIWIFVVVPPLSRAIGSSVDGMVAAGPGGPAAPGPGGMNFTQLYAIFYTIQGLVTLLIGAIYPTILLIVLRRPGVRAACIGARPGGPSTEPGRP